MVEAGGIESVLGVGHFWTDCDGLAQNEHIVGHL